MSTEDKRAADEVQRLDQHQEKRVGEFIAAKRTELNLPEWAQLSVSSACIGGTWAIYGHGTFDGAFSWINGDGATIAEAHAAFLSKIPPTGPALVALKREQAAKLLAEADKMEGAQ